MMLCRYLITNKYILITEGFFPFVELRHQLRLNETRLMILCRTKIPALDQLIS